jgi:selenocysteine lyase/cysteine desulfurase
VVEQLRRSEFLVTQHGVYLDHATFGPLPASNIRAAAAMLDSLANPDAEGLGGTQLLESVRFQAAIMLHCDPGRVALLKSTSEGLGLLAQGLDWRAGDEVVVYERDFWGCLAPFLRLADIGVCVRLVPDLGRGRFDLDDLERLLTPRTRAVCLSVVNRATGMRAPVEAIGDVCRDRGLWYALDAAQALGVHRIDAPNLSADIVAAHGYKFLASGFGVAPTYCSERALAELRVPQVGWKNTRLAATEPNVELVTANAERYESTMPSLPTLAGMLESLRLLNSVDDSVREHRAVALIRSLREQVRARGYEVVSSSRPDEGSALLVVRHPSLPADEVARLLRSAEVACGVVDDCLRFSAHFYNTDEDVSQLLAALPAV